LHAAAFSYDPQMAGDLITRGAGIRARNRRGAEPIHAAVTGAPGSASWNPASQRDAIVYLIEAGADPNAAAAGGVTPLHRAVRNRCSAAVEALLRAGADPRLPNDRGSTASDLARWTTGRGGTGSAAARAEQRNIIELLASSTGQDTSRPAAFRRIPTRSRARSPTASSSGAFDRAAVGGPAAGRGVNHVARDAAHASLGDPRLGRFTPRPFLRRGR
jgi:hypothetical protein